MSSGCAATARADLDFITIKKTQTKEEKSAFFWPRRATRLHRGHRGHGVFLACVEIRNLLSPPAKPVGLLRRTSNLHRPAAGRRPRSARRDRLTASSASKNAWNCVRYG